MNSVLQYISIYEKLVTILKGHCFNLQMFSFKSMFWKSRSAMPSISRPRKKSESMIKRGSRFWEQPWTYREDWRPCFNEMASSTTNLAERPSTCSSRSLAVLDSIWAVAVCLPAVCLYWRGGWSRLDFYILSDHVPNKYWLMVALGNLMLVTFWLLEPLDAHLRDAARVKYVIVTRVLFYYQGWWFMFYW